MTHFAIYETSVGFFKIVEEDEMITFIQKINHTDISDFGVKTELTNQVYTQLNEYFLGKRKVFNFPYVLKGTDFQKKVWTALSKIPYGETRTYKDIAKTIGNEKACRAVGMANNKNPLIIVIPCHRIIGSNGKLVGYAGGLPMKELLLDIEK